MRMNDLISRQDAINTALEFFVEFLSGAFHEDDQKILIKRMNDLPSAQSGIIRCENCANRDDDKWEAVEKVYWCDVMDGFVDSDDYCSYAERNG